MAINRFRYYLGPVGALQPLPRFPGSTFQPEAPIRLPAGVHESLNGRVTQDRVGVAKRSWSLEFNSLSEADRMSLDAALHSATGAALRLIDPRSTNRLPVDASSGGSVTQSTGAFDSSVAVTDAFGAVVSSSWGSTDTGQPWTNTGGAASDFSKASGRGVHALTSVNVVRCSTVNTPIADFDISVSVASDKLATGASQSPGLVGRFVDVNNDLEARLEFSITQTVVLTVIKRVAGTGTTLAQVTITGLTHGVGTRFTIRFKGTGSLLQAKAWLSSANQPTTWNISVVDSTYLAAGQVGVRTLLFTGNTNTSPVTFTYDDFQALGVLPLAYLAGSVPTALVGYLGGGQDWSGLFLNSTLTAITEKMPIIAGSTYRFSVYAAGTAQVKLIARPFNSADVEQTVATGLTETLTGTLTRYSWLWTPSAGQVSAWFGLQAQGTGNVQTTGWHVGIDRASLDPWSFGVGCPEVFVDSDISVSYWRLKYHQMRLVLREV